MWRLVAWKHHLRVSHSCVRLMPQQMEPVGVSRRQRRRLSRRTYSIRDPNDVWRVDEYDKLAPYGMMISGLVNMVHNTHYSAPLWSFDILVPYKLAYYYYYYYY